MSCISSYCDEYCENEDEYVNPPQPSMRST